MLAQPGYERAPEASHLGRGGWNIQKTGSPLRAAVRHSKAIDQDLEEPLSLGSAPSRAASARIVAAVKEAVAEQLPTLVFCCTVDHARSLAIRLAAARITAAALDCRMPRRNRQQVVNAFRSGSLMALFNFGVLSTGFDAPNVGCVVIARPTSSIVLYSQMIGRGLRGEAVGGGGAFRLVDVRDNLRAFGSLDQLYAHFSGYWDVPST
jgi:superfamily II DNA or RNA helicase